MSDGPTKTTKERLEEIPGTYVFNRERCREGYHLNMFFSSLLRPENRSEFQADEAKYLEKFRLTPEQKRCVLERDWSGMLKVGGNIYHMSKLGGNDQKTFQYLAASMSGMTQEAYREMMVKGGRSIEGNRTKEEK